MKVKVKVKLLSGVLLLETPWTAAHQPPPSMGFFQARVLEWGTIAFSDMCLRIGINYLCNCIMEGSVRFSHSVVSNFLQPHGTVICQASLCPSPTPRACSNSRPSSWWCYPTISSSVVPFSSCPQSFPGSGSFPKSALHIRWPNYRSFSFSISPSNEYSGLTSFRMDCLDLLAVQGTLKSLLQHHSSKASILWRSAL